MALYALERLPANGFVIEVLLNYISQKSQRIVISINSDKSHLSSQSFT